MSDYGQSLFQGTSHYFAKYRPVYPSVLIRFLVQRFGLDGAGTLLDLGSGTGQLTCRFSDWFEKMIGLDNQPEMVDEAVRTSKERRISNVEWLHGKAEDFLRKNNDQDLRLVTMAKSFHWMERDQVLELLFPAVVPGGGVAIIDDFEREPVLEPWQETLQALSEKWYGDLRRAGNKHFAKLTKSHEEVVDESAFELEIHRFPSCEYTWTIESIIGNHYSTSYGAKRFLGDRAHLFEKELKEQLLEINPSGLFTENRSHTIILGVKA